MIKTIDVEPDFIEDEIYGEQTRDISYTRKNRFLPKDIHFKPGNMISIRLPAKLKDEQSHIMENRLHKYFYGDIKIEYYKDPN